MVSGWLYFAGVNSWLNGLTEQFEGAGGVKQQNANQYLFVDGQSTCLCTAFFKKMCNIFELLDHLVGQCVVVPFAFIFSSFSVFNDLLELYFSVFFSIFLYYFVYFELAVYCLRLHRIP